MDTKAVPATVNQPSVLKAFSHALGREAHVLTQHPELLWQQMYNRLQWEGDELEDLLAPEVAKRKTPGTSPWMQTKTPTLASETLIRTLSGHSARVNACLFSRDGSQVVSYSDRELKVWNLHSGMELKNFTRTSGRHDFSINQKSIWIIFFDLNLKLIKITQAISGQEVCSLAGDIRDLREFVISPGGSYILSTRWNSLVRWDAANGKEVWKINGAGFPCAVSPDGTWIISNYKIDDQSFPRQKRVQLGRSQKGEITTQRRLIIWDAARGKEICEFKENILDPHTFWISPDSRWILSATKGRLTIWDSKTGEILRSLKGPEAGSSAPASIVDCDISPDGQRIVCAYGDNSLRIWEAVTGEELQSIHHPTGFRSCRFSPDGCLVATASSDQVHIWNVYADVKLPAIPSEGPLAERFSKEVYDFFSTPDGNWVTIRSGALKIMDPSNGKELWSTKPGNVNFPYSISPDGTQLAALGASDWHGARKVSVWNIKKPDDGKPLVLPVTNDPMGERIQFTFSQDSRWIITQQRDVRNIYSKESAKTLSIWDTNSGEKIRVFGESWLGFTLFPDGIRLIERGEHSLVIWNMRTGEKLQALKPHAQINGFTVSPDGRWIISIGQKNVNFAGWELKILDADTGQEAKVIQGHYIFCAVSPDARWILTASGNRMIRILNKESGESIASISLTSIPVEARFHPWKPRCLYEDEGGNSHIIDLVGIDYGSIILTASEQGNELIILCPSCQTHHPITQSQLGSELICPTPDCGLRLKINSFVIQKPVVA